MFVYEVMSLAISLIMKAIGLYVEEVGIIMIEGYQKHYFINSFIMLSFVQFITKLLKETPDS